MSKQSRQKSRRHKHRNPPTVDRLDQYSLPTRSYSYWGASTQPEPSETGRTEPEWQEIVARVEVNARLAELGLTARRLPGKGDVRIYAADAPAPHRLAIVSDNVALVDGRDRISGNFLSNGGRHWDRLHDALASLVEVSEARSIADEQITTAAPIGASRRLVERAMEASRVIWDGVDPLVRPVVLPGEQFTITFWPPVEQNSITGLPFEYRPHDGASISGRLCPHQPRTEEIMPVAASASIEPEELWTAWVVALCEFAKFIDMASRPNDRERVPRPDQPSGVQLRVVRSAFVRPFVRRLREGDQVSPRAVANARARGVELEDGKTFVREHVRKGADDQPLRIESWISSIQLDEIGVSLPRAA